MCFMYIETPPSSEHLIKLQHIFSCVAIMNCIIYFTVSFVNSRSQLKLKGTHDPRTYCMYGVFKHGLCTHSIHTNCRECIHTVSI